MLYGSETWAMGIMEDRMLDRAEMRMLRWMAGISLRDCRSNEWVRNLMRVEAVGEVARRGRLRWYGHVERMDEGCWIRTCRDLVVEGKRPRGRPRKTWEGVLQEDMKKVGLVREDARDRERWRSMLVKIRPTPVIQGRRPLKLL